MSKGGGSGGVNPPLRASFGPAALPAQTAHFAPDPPLAAGPLSIYTQFRLQETLYEKRKGVLVKFVFDVKNELYIYDKKLAIFS